MIVRAATAFAAFFIVSGTGMALAQYYPAPPPGYRPLPQVVAEDDDIPVYDPPPGYRRMGPGVYSRPVPPSEVDAYPVVPNRRYQAGPPMPAPEQDAYIPPPPAGFIYRESAPPPGYGHAPVTAQPQPPAYPAPQPQEAIQQGYQQPQQGYQPPPQQGYPQQAAPAPQPGSQDPNYSLQSGYSRPVGAPAARAYEPPVEDGFRPPMPIGPSQAMPAPGGHQPMTPGPGLQQPAGAPQQDVTGNVRGDPRMASLGPDYQPETGPRKTLPPQFQRTLVDYRTKEPPGTLIVDTPNTYLYLVMPGGKAMRYGIGVGREGFTWTGVEKVTRMAEWPDWNPPPEMIERQPYLPRFMAGGETNPLGARALYLGKTVYRIHGTNQPSTIGTFVSSGCIRLTNEDIQDLYTRVKVGTRVMVLPGKAPATAQAAPPQQYQGQPLPPPVSVR